MAEWNWAVAYKKDTEGIYSQPEEWAKYLLEKQQKDRPNETKAESSSIRFWV